MLNLNQPQGSVGTSPALDGTGLTNPTNWRSLLGVDSLTDSRRRAFAGGQPGVSFDGATSGTRITSSLTGQQIGTGDFTVWVRFRCPASIPASGNGSLPGLWALTDMATATFRANAILLYLDNANQLRLFRYGATQASDNRIATVTGFVTAWAGQVVDVVTTRSGNTVKLYVNGAEVGFNETSSGAAPTWGSSIVSDFFNVGMQSAANIFGDRVYRAVLFNRALSAQDVADLVNNGVAEADQWGTQTAAYSSNFASGADGWSFVRATVTGNVDAILGVDDTLRIVPDTSPGTTHYTHNTAVPGMATGKRYRLGFSYYVPGGNAVANGLQMWQGGIAGSVTGVLNTTGAWTNISPVEFVATSSRLDLLATSSGNTNFTGNGTDALYAKSFVLTRIGALVDLNLGEGAGLCFTDRSTNALHAIGLGGVAHVVAGREGCVRVRTTGTGNIQLGGAGIIPANGRIRFITADAVSGTPTVTMGNASGGAQHVASVALAAGINELTVAARFNTTGNLWVNVSTSATVDWTVIYDIVD